LAIATPLGAGPIFRQQLYNFQRLAAMKRQMSNRVRVGLDAQISTLVTYWAELQDGGFWGISGGI
jgi:hypothetical protein